MVKSKDSWWIEYEFKLRFDSFVQYVQVDELDKS